MTAVERRYAQKDVAHARTYSVSHNRRGGARRPLVRRLWSGKGRGTDVGARADDGDVWRGGSDDDTETEHAAANETESETSKGRDDVESEHCEGSENSSPSDESQDSYESTEKTQRSSKRRRKRRKVSDDFDFSLLAPGWVAIASGNTAIIRVFTSRAPPIVAVFINLTTGIDKRDRVLRAHWRLLSRGVRST